MSILSQCLPCEKNFWNSKFLSDPICLFSTCWVKLVANKNKDVKDSYQEGGGDGGQSHPTQLPMQVMLCNILWNKSDLNQSMKVKFWVHFLNMKTYPSFFIIK